MRARDRHYRPQENERVVKPIPSLPSTLSSGTRLCGPRARCGRREKAPPSCRQDRRCPDSRVGSPPPREHNRRQRQGHDQPRLGRLLSGRSWPHRSAEPPRHRRQRLLQRRRPAPPRHLSRHGPSREFPLPVPSRHRPQLLRPLGPRHLRLPQLRHRLRVWSRPPRLLRPQACPWNAPLTRPPLHQHLFRRPQSPRPWREMCERPLPRRGLQSHRPRPSPRSRRSPRNRRPLRRQSPLPRPRRKALREVRLRLLRPLPLRPGRLRHRFSPRGFRWPSLLPTKRYPQLLASVWRRAGAPSSRPNRKRLMQFVELQPRQPTWPRRPSVTFRAR